MDGTLTPDIDHSMRLPWELICKVAVKARVYGVSFNDAVELALRQYLDQAKKGK